MGWQIQVLENTVVVPEEYAERLFEAGDGEHFFGEASDVLDEEGHLHFESDAMEHMDYLWDDDILAVLEDAQVNGRVVFSSNEGDNAGTWWAYDFNNGVVTQSRGETANSIAQTSDEWDRLGEWLADQVAADVMLSPAEVLAKMEEIEDGDDL